MEQQSGASHAGHGMLAAAFVHTSASEVVAYSAAAAYLERMEQVRSRGVARWAGLPIGAPYRRERVVPYWFDGGK